MPVSHADDNAGDHGTTRRDFLYYATAGAGAIAAGAAGWTLINQMNPSADVQALSSIQVDISGVTEGTQLTVKWLGKPVFIRHRTPAEIEQLEWLKARFAFRSNSDAIRALVRAASGMLEFDPVTAGKLDEVRGELRKIGVNVNQIARAVNRGQAPPMSEAGKDLAELKSQLRKVLPALNNVVQEARRSNERVWAAARASDAAGEGDGE